jgi:hypothetical protein
LKALEDYAAAKAAAWKAFVEFAWRYGRQNPEALTKAEQLKVKAITEAGLSGMSREEIVAAGQTEILSRDARRRKKYSERQRVLSWRVSRALADAVMSSVASPDQEEALVTRLVRVCHLRTSEELWEFLLSEYVNVSDEELEHRAQVVLEKRRKHDKRTTSQKVGG